MDSLGALLLLMCARVITCQRDWDGRGHRSRLSPPMSQTSDEASTVGEIYVRDTEMLDSRVIYLPLRNEHFGVFHKVEAFFMSTEPVYLQVWQFRSGNTYKLIHQFKMQSKTANISQTFSQDRFANFRCPVVRKGDRFGIFSLGQKTPIPVVPADKSMIPLKEQLSEVDSENELEFKTVYFAYKFSLKLYIHEVIRGNRAGARYAPCPEDISATRSASGRVTILPTTKPTTTTTTKIQHYMGMPKGVRRPMIPPKSSVGTAPKEGSPDKTIPPQSPVVSQTRRKGIQSPPQSPEVTTVTRDDYQREATLDRTRSTVGRVNLSKLTPSRTTALPRATMSSNELNALTITVAVLAGVAVISVSVVVVVCRRHGCQKHRHRRLSANGRQDSSSGSTPGHPETPSSPNPAYGISCDFLNARRSSLDGTGGEYETISDSYRPVVPERPVRRSGIADRPDSATRTPSGARTEHTYLEFVYDDADSGMGGSVSGSRPPSGVSQSSS